MPLENVIFAKKIVKTDAFKLNYLFQAQSSPFTGHNGKCNICILNKEIKLFEGCFCHIIASCSSFSGKHSMVKSTGFDRFMTSESRETLILAFTSKTGQSVRIPDTEYLKKGFSIR